MKLLIFVLALSVFFFTSCEKELSLELQQPKLTKAEQLQSILTSSKFQLKAFYSDIPVDYIQTDHTVKQETDLWQYVSYYLKDDIYIFFSNNKDVDIDQNRVKMGGLTDSLLHKTYTIATDDEGLYMNFLDYQYTPLTYRIAAFDDDYFILAVKWEQGATLYSRFERLP